MPIVSINLSPKAYEVYQRLSLSRKASRITSQMLVQWDAQQENKHEANEYPSLEFGDLRTMSNGDLAQWTDSGWAKVVLLEEVKETANEKWIREQKEAFKNE